METSSLVRMARVSLVRLGGRVAYTRALALQRELARRRRGNEAGNSVLVLEHSPVFTLGKLQDSASNVLSARDEIASAGATVVQSDRGGNVTFHGPGQVVVYPILHLADFRRDLRWFVHALEDVMVETVAAFGIPARRGGPSTTGAWVGRRKIGAIGVRVTRWVTSHGIALNANPDLSFFKMIAPCGLRDAPDVTSIAAELGRPVSVDEVLPHLTAAFSRVLRCDVVGATESAVPVRTE